ncbi:MAG TPA: hydrogenase maturation protease [Candidatus Margulisiibacteriota bacterium]|nr:hydrogenase maturation protease [Candidatus Margulisiibacteriota bacterium]
MTRIIGIGSPFGDDAAGLEAARRLAATPPPGAEVIAVDRPGATLIDLFEGADAVILIDAAHSGARAGTIHDMDLHVLASHTLELISSHDLGVAEAVQLAARLGRLPARGRVLGIAIASHAATQRTGLSTSVRAVIRGVVRRARRWNQIFTAVPLARR